MPKASVRQTVLLPLLSRIVVLPQVSFFMVVVLPPLSVQRIVPNGSVRQVVPAIADVAISVATANAKKYFILISFSFG